jgi:hypothetical protein
VFGFINIIAGKPKLRLGLNLFLTISIGLTSSIVASQIMPDGNLTWSLLTDVMSFKILLVLGVLWFLIQCKLLDYDENVLKFADDQHCLAYIRKAHLDAMVKVIQKDPNQAQLMEIYEADEN